MAFLPPATFIQNVGPEKSRKFATEILDLLGPEKAKPKAKPEAAPEAKKRSQDGKEENEEQSVGE